MVCPSWLHTIDYLDNPFGPLNEKLEVRCEIQPEWPLVGWSLSSDGIDSLIPINTSLAKYTVSGNTLSINGVDASDEGIYCCVYTNGRIQRLCIKVYGKSVNNNIIIIDTIISPWLRMQPKQCLLPARAAMMDAVNRRTYQLQQERTSIWMPQSFIR